MVNRRLTIKERAVEDALDIGIAIQENDVVTFHRRALALYRKSTNWKAMGRIPKGLAPDITFEDLI